MELRIDRCYDSHVHLLGTGEKRSILNLASLTSPEDVSRLTITEQNQRSGWLLGRGWDQTRWPQSQMPHKNILDQVYPHHPVCFTRVDGHALWVNSLAIERAGGESAFKDYENDGVGRDQEGKLSGIFIDRAMNPFLKVVPEPSPQEIKSYLLLAMEYFVKNGFTHVRELTCNQTQFDILLELEKQNKLKLAIELFFDANPYSPFQIALEAAQKCRTQKSRLLRVKGIKFFYDGALGSEGALLSCCYPSGHKGLRLMEPQELKEVLLETWKHGLEPAIHVIGDEAAHEVANVIHEIAQTQKIQAFHLEHAEVLRPETINLLQLYPTIIHFQPCHWHSDKRWLREKLGSLADFAFPLAAAEKAGLKFYFGSDCPVEEASIHSNRTAIQEMVSLGYQPMASRFEDHHSHPDSNWIDDCWTEFKNDQPQKVFFEKEKVYFSDEAASFSNAERSIR